MPELKRRFACSRLKCSAGILTWAGQDEFESPFPELVDDSRQGFQHGIRSPGQPVVQQDDVPACRLIQDAPGKKAGICSECITRPNGPRNILQPRIFKIRLQERVTQTHRGAEKTRPDTTTAANALRATLDLNPQTPGHEKTK